MSEFKTWHVQTDSPRATEQLAETIGQHLHGGEVIELTSDLGGGKTTFVRGLARGAGSTNNVSSPTFKISNEYRAPHFSMYHFDFYRLPEAGLIANELAEVIGDPKAVCVIEWAKVAHNVLPAERLTIELENHGELERGVTIHYPESLSYLLEGIVS